MRIRDGEVEWCGGGWWWRGFSKFDCYFVVDRGYWLGIVGWDVFGGWGFMFCSCVIDLRVLIMLRNEEFGLFNCCVIEKLIIIDK